MNRGLGATVSLSNRRGWGLGKRGLPPFPARFSGKGGCPLFLQRGFTFVELLVVTTLLLILASAAMPLARVTMQRQREADLRRSLREMRTAIDKFKDDADMGQIGATDLKAGAVGYPPVLENLVEGVSVVGDASGRKLKFLRRIPIDPMTNSTEWGKRSYQDKPDSTSWGGQNVFDVYTRSQGTALDGTKYRDW
jgi:general secretion pathway protein G